MSKGECPQHCLCVWDLAQANREAAKRIAELEAEVKYLKLVSLGWHLERKETLGEIDIIWVEPNGTEHWEDVDVEAEIARLKSDKEE